VRYGRLQIVHYDRLAEGIVHVPARNDPSLQGFERVPWNAAVNGVLSPFSHDSRELHNSRLTNHARRLLPPQLERFKDGERNTCLRRPLGAARAPV
jgi:hypothetical protein